LLTFGSLVAQQQPVSFVLRNWANLLAKINVPEWFNFIAAVVECCRSGPKWNLSKQQRIESPERTTERNGTVIRAQKEELRKRIGMILS
jgi:hypothetical protein